jgi:hypothetical protein
VDGPFRFSVKFEFGYGLLYTSPEMRAGCKEAFGSPETRVVEVLAFDATQAVFQVQMSLRKEAIESMRDYPPDNPKKLGTIKMRERKHLLILSVEPCARQT